ncbi:MAG TPA: pyridoxamine 5'-phosphate oxidase family protein [Gaiellaceae bacterium]|nr:pyridoxamine 5'-phosphate oxidase family protein [Gaiellaceae bacterium]
MGKVYDAVDGKLRAWIEAQPLFFVGTAPSGADGHVNVSPKGGPELLRILGPRQVAYLDLIGSGAETVAHLRENGRIVLMLCAFHGPPRVVRLHGRGRVVPQAEAGFEERDDARGAILVDLDRISDSCGYGVPLMQLEGTRPQQAAWAAKKRRDGAFEAYVREKNAVSIDGLPAVQA